MPFPPGWWSNAPLRLYHGTTLESARRIAEEGVRVSEGRRGTDFGPGFYATTVERQAWTWAWQLGERRRAAPAVVAADVDRDALGELCTLAFVRGDFDAEDFWRFVVYCRRGARDHGRHTPAGGLYDVVVGPAAAIWRQRLSLSDTDQVSFHTAAAEDVLNRAPWEIHDQLPAF
ncbi:MAG TPA: DUF3990 domain-containing protein [Longimicrobium sp.]|nr:DUF3990 domain-containing protein [Longimicrobium sp.]